MAEPDFFLYYDHWTLKERTLILITFLYQLLNLDFVRFSLKHGSSVSSYDN